MAELIRAAVAHQRGDWARAIAVARAERGFEEADMMLLAAVAKRRQGQLGGGESGHTRRDAANAWMNAQSIVAPSRMAALYGPGFEPTHEGA